MVLGSHPPPQSASEGCIGGARGLGNVVRPESPYSRCPGAEGRPPLGEGEGGAEKKTKRSVICTRD